VQRAIQDVIDKAPGQSVRAPGTSCPAAAGPWLTGQAAQAVAVPASVVDGIIMKDAEKDRGPHYTIYILNLQLPTRGAKPIVVNAAGSAAQPGDMVRGAEACKCAPS
jgi:hypothetical protein